MPIYERRCLGVDCGDKFTHLCKMDERTRPVDCPTCGHEFTKSVMSATRTTFTFADPSPFKGPKNYGKGRRAKYIKDEHGLTPDGE